jgi:phage terminase large subunit
MLEATTAQYKISRLKKRVRIVQGGTSSSKTFSILPLLIQYALQTPNSEISVVSESIPHLKRGAIKDFLKILKWVGNFQEDNFNRSNLTYKFTNGSYIEFFSADQSDKLRGARRDILFINECNNVTFESYQQLSIRTKKFIYLDYNPTNEFWVHSELKDEKDSDFIILTYKDNEALDSAIVKEIEKAKVKAETSSYWANWWKVYGLGQLGSLEGVIFSNWSMIGSIPATAKLLGYGQDFGFTSDPAATIAVYSYDGKIILHELVYKRGLLNVDLVKEYKRLGVNLGLPIWADKAEPKSIKEISGYGYRIEGADKGPDSVNFGIDLLQGYDMLVTSESTNLIAELRTYQWEKDRSTGKNTNVPKDANNHAIDAVRYLAVMMLTNYQPNYKGKGHGRIKPPSKKEFYKDFI